MRRWSLNRSQMTMALTELREMCGLEKGETSATQTRKGRIAKDNSHLGALTASIEETCNPFRIEEPTLINIATGKAASSSTSEYLLSTLERGEMAKVSFHSEWEGDPKRFFKPVKRIPIKHFASETLRTRRTVVAKVINAENLRDVFTRILLVAARNTRLDMRTLLRYPITDYPMALAHPDGVPIKTEKARLLKKLESLQVTTEAFSELAADTKIFDGCLIVHSMLSQTAAGMTYGQIARQILASVCTGSATEIHLCLDRYQKDSIKEGERRLRGADDREYVITGSHQTTKHSGQQLLKNSIFKNELAKFLLGEWSKDAYGPLLRGKEFFASHGGQCYRYAFDNVLWKVTTTEPPHLQADHKEADTLIAYHLAQCTGSIVIRASDTDVCVIVLGHLAKLRPELLANLNVSLDCGMGNNRRLLDLKNILEQLEAIRPGLPAALPGFHAFTGSDFTSAFYRFVYLPALFCPRVSVMKNALLMK